MSPKPVAVLASGRGSNLQALLDAARAPGAPYAIKLVLSNNPGVYALERARAAGIEAITVDHRPFGKDRPAFERAMIEEIETRGVELIALAGFMRVLTPTFVGYWEGRMINIHPSLLPLFPGLHTHARAIAAGMRVHGCTVHWVSDEVDSGAIIGQAAVPVLPGDTPDALAARVLEAEHKLYPRCLALAAGGSAEPPFGAMVVNGF